MDSISPRTQRDNSNCASDFEGGTPVVIPGDLPTGAPLVAADPAHDAFFIADTVIQSSDAYAISVMKSTSANLLNSTTCPSGTQHNPNACWNVQVDANSLPFVRVGAEANASDWTKFTGSSRAW
jgi:hypothetical protein